MNSRRRTRARTALALLLGLVVLAAACAPAAPPEVLAPGPDRLLSASSLAPGAALVSPNGTMLTMRADGNAVLTAAPASGGAALWSTGTSGNPGARLELRFDGNLIVWSADGHPLWENARSGTGESYLAVGDDGSLVQYQPAPGGRRAVWDASNPSVHPDRTGHGCPIGAHHDLCARSVALARSNTAARAVKFAFSQVGVPYNAVHRLGLSGYDCSGLVWRAYLQAGVDIGASTSATIVSSGGPRTEIPIGAVRPGDVIWYPGHVAIELADGFMIEAAKPGTDVRVVRSGGRGFTRAVAIAGA